MSQGSSSAQNVFFWGVGGGSHNFNTHYLKFMLFVNYISSMMSGSLVKDEKAGPLLEIKNLKMEKAEHQDKHEPFLSNESL